jgi:two-component system chemotaxis response regulator CheB
VKRDIIVIGTSAGGIETLKRLLAAIPADIPAAIFVVMHLSPQSPGSLPKILERATALPVVSPKEKTRVKRGTLYVAPPDLHMALGRGHALVARGPKENRNRPSVNVLFRSAAQVYGPRVVGTVLSGALDDGTAGLWAVKQCGGMAIVQNPEDALFPGMPTSALEKVSVDYRLNAEEIGAKLNELARKTVKNGRRYPVPAHIKLETEFAMMESRMSAMDAWGTPAGLACPSCTGSLWQVKEGRALRFRCHTGHAFSGESLLSEQSEGLEEALYSALRALSEKAALARRLAATYDRKFPHRQAEREAEAKRLDAAGDTIRRQLVQLGKQSAAV